MSLLLLLTANQNVSTKLYLRSTQSNGIGATYYDLDIVARAASDTAVDWLQPATDLRRYYRVVAEAN